MITSMPKDQAEAFGLLRRPQLLTDLLPENRWEAYTRDVVRYGQLGINPGLARRARTPLGNVWVLPGDGWICFSRAASVDPSSLDGGGMGFSPTQSAIESGMVSWTGSRSGRGQMVQGLVPDGVTEVSLIAADGSVIKPGISDNVYGADLRSALARVCVDGETILSLGLPQH